LFVAAAELATQRAAWDRQVGGVSRVTAPMVARIDTMLHAAEASIVMPTEFVVPGETVVSAAIELARTIVRRAERRAVRLGAEGLIPGPHLLPYLNRLADLLWVLARAAEQAEARSAPPSRPDRRRAAVDRAVPAASDPRVRLDVRRAPGDGGRRRRGPGLADPDELRVSQLPPAVLRPAGDRGRDQRRDPADQRHPRVGTVLRLRGNARSDGRADRPGLHDGLGYGRLP